MKNPDRNAQHIDRSAADTIYRFKLFVAGGEPNSKMAIGNFEKIRSLIDSPCELEIIDVLEDFRTALAHDILVTPTLLQIAPSPAVVIIGNLNDIPRVLAALSIKEAVNDR